MRRASSSSRRGLTRTRCTPATSFCWSSASGVEIQEGWKQEAGKAWANTGLVLTTRHGDALDPRNFHRAFKLRANAAGVPEIPVHATRKTCASLLVALDVHPRVAMAILRHSKIAITMEIYSQVSSASTRKALKRLGSQLGDVK
jgi:integrase